MVKSKVGVGVPSFPETNIPTVAFLSVKFVMELFVLPCVNQMVPHCPGTSLKEGSNLSLSKMTSFSNSSVSELVPFICSEALLATIIPDSA